MSALSALPDSARDPHVGLILYSTACAALLALIFLTHWPSYHFQIRGGPTVWYYYALACALTIPAVCAQPALALRLLRVPLFWWFAAYVLTGLVWLIASQDFIEDGSRLWRLRLLSFLLFSAVLVLMLYAKRPFIALLILCFALLASAFSWFDVMRPYRFVPQGMEGSSPGRGAGMFMNANSAAEFVIMGSIVALPFIPMRFRGIVLVAMVVGVAPTLSRAGLLMALAVLVAAICVKMLNRTQSMIVLIAVPLLIVATNVYYDTLIRAADSPLETTIKRLTWFEEAEEDESVEARKWAAGLAQDMFLDQPLVGHGIGATTRESVSVGPHNMYLTLMAEQGIIGLGLYLSLIYTLFAGGQRLRKSALTSRDQDIGKAMIMYAALVLMDGFFTHNFLEESYGMFVLAFLAAAAANASRSGFVVQHRPLTPARMRWRSTIPASPNEGRLNPQSRSSGVRELN